MRSVQIAELKNRLSAHLNLVRAGEEIVIRDRSVAIAKIVPLGLEESDLEERELVAAGLLSVPKKPFDLENFWKIGRGIRTPKLNRTVLQKAIDAAREDLDVSVLGLKRRSATVRSRASNQPR
jgi:antitoxin (DNA-binding transcriptional repressor) of toxin-antitoxin stability system